MCLPRLKLLGTPMFTDLFSFIIYRLVRTSGQVVNKAFTSDFCLYTR